MTDYYGILRSAIDETGAETADARATIYLRAWAALEAQFDSPDVALPDDARKQQRQLMDEAISRIEREFGASEDEATAATAALDKDIDGQADNPAGAPVTEDAGPDSPAVAPAPDGGKMADQAIPDTAAAAPWRPDNADAGAADAPAASSAADKPLPGSPPPRQAGERRGRGGLIAVLILLLLAAAGAGAAWWRWDDVESVMASVMPGEDEVSSTGSEETGEVAVSSQESAGTAERTTMETAAPAPKQDAMTAPEQETAAESAAGEMAQAPQAMETPQTTDAPADSDSNQQAEAEAETAAADAAKDQERVDGTGAVVERAYLIQEAEEQGKEDLRFAGQARWTVEGTGAAAVLTIDMQVPERSAALRVTMRENDDAALPASHTIDLIYQGPNGGPNLQDVAGIMAIQDSIEKAAPLRAAGALVVPGQYLLALRGSQSDRADNMERLSDAKWLAVRALFDDSKHAVFLIEKGDRGGAVLEEALSAWGDGQTGQTGAGQ